MTDFNLTFNVLRQANEARLPLFKNGRGEPAHDKPDGSDWSLSDWSNAAMGELGEAAGIIKKIRRGDYTLDTIVTVKDASGNPTGEFLPARELLAKELADTVTYIDILAKQIGVDLGDAIAEKFNEISDRINVPVKIVQAEEDAYGVVIPPLEAVARVTK